MKVAAGRTGSRPLSRQRAKTGSRSRAALVLWLLLLSMIVMVVSPRSPAASGFQTAGQFAATVIGQANFTSSSVSLSPDSLSMPFRSAFDSSGDLWVGDEGNHRVVEFRPPFTDGEAAYLEIGQPSFTASVNSSVAASLTPATQSSLYSPIALAFDHSGDLWVSDFVDNRVTEYRPPFTNGMNASLELGQPAGDLQFVSHSGRDPDEGLHAPVDLTFDSSGNLWVTDTGNNRVVEYTPPFVDGGPPSIAIGQMSLNSSAPSTTQSGLSLPESISFDSSGNLWVVDQNNNRVLEFTASSLKSDGPRATVEIGQAPGPRQFLTNASGSSQSAFNRPLGVVFSPSGDLLVSDRANNRIVGFKPPFADGMNASFEIGQPAGPDQFTRSLSSTSQDSLRNPLGITFDPSGNLWVADQLNGRVLEFSGPATATAASDAVASDGTAAADEAAATGIKTSVAGVPSGSVVNFYSADLESQPLGTGTPGLGNPVEFYHAKVSGQGGGTAELCVSDSHVSSLTGMAFYDGAKWTDASGINRTMGVSICGSVLISTMASLTLLAVGSTAVASPAPPILQAAALVAAAMAFGAIAYVVLKRRSRR
jgi:sugar lactone lactonase YvrE